MINVNGLPVNGVDLSHWNPDPPRFVEQEWLEFFGHKAVHVGGDKMVNGVDPKFHERRLIARRVDIRWRAFYIWLVPASVARLAVQVELLVRTVGRLLPGESVYLDWEQYGVTAAQIEELATYMDLEFPGRWFIYANDSNEIAPTADIPGSPGTFDWLKANQISRRVPLMHPNYNAEKGMGEATKWGASVWQCGKGTPPGFAAGSVVPMDYVLHPKVMDKVCGRAT